MSMEALALLPTEIGGYVKFAVGTVNPFRIHTDNWTESTIQPIIVHSNQETVLLQSDWGYFSLGSLDSGTDAPRSMRNIDNLTGMDPQAPIVTKIPYSNSKRNCHIFDSFRGT